MFIFQLATALTVAAGAAAVPSRQAPQRADGAASVAVAARAHEAPEIDGRDTDGVWQNAMRFDEFRQFDPKNDADPSLRTEVRVAYDQHNLYVFARMFDPHPDSIMHALTRRDERGPSDQIKILIDSYDDKRSGYEFAVNPDGVKRDYAMYNDGNEDGSWNGIWDVATLVDSLGWTAEFRIPLSQLRYNEKPSHTFGFGVWRDIERYTERDSWPLYVTTKAGLSSQLGRLSGIEGIGSARSVEVVPYVVTKNVQESRAVGGFQREQQITAGGDLKLGLTPNVTLNATVNPDFGQVEADPAVLNLSAFETFFPERRPFFVEGVGLYTFRLNCYIVVDCSTNEGLFYSRRIGRSPTLRGAYGDATTATATPIAAATKLTGRSRGGLSFGLLDAFTMQVEGAQGRTVEPRTNYAVASMQQDLRGGETSVKLIATAVNRGLDTWTESVLHRDAYVAGADFRSRFGARNYELDVQLTGSRVSGSRDAILRTQSSPVHYFQQPDDDVTIDSDATSLDGWAGQVKFGKYGGGITRFETSLVRQSPGFEVNDLGFLRRADILDWSTWAQLSWRNPTGVYRWASVNFNHWERWNTSGTRLDNAINLNGHIGLLNNWDAHAGGTIDGLTASYCDRCTRGGPLLRSSRGVYPWFGFNSDGRKTVSGGWWTNLSFGDEGKSHGYSLDPYVTYRPSTRLQATLSAGYARDHNDVQWYGNFAENNGPTHYAFAHLDQRTLSSSIRVNYTATPDLSLELYAQPFVSSGTYTDFREVSGTPDAASYDDRFVAYAPPEGSSTQFKFAQLRTNTVLRWEYRPGSTLFLVWSQGREDFQDRYSQQEWHRDYRDIFALHPDNTFLVKIAYWFSN